jgi:hypothetical protein
MNLTEPRLQDALDALKLLSLVFESSGSRVPRYEHNFQRVLGVPEQSAVLLGLLMLRGPQTAGELRINSERWYRFADISSVDAFLDELQDRSAEKGGPLVVRLPRAPGAREQRWAHCCAGRWTPARCRASRSSRRVSRTTRGGWKPACSAGKRGRPCVLHCKMSLSNSGCHNPDRQIERPCINSPAWRTHWRHPMDLAFTPEEQKFREDIRAWVHEQPAQGHFAQGAQRPAPDARRHAALGQNSGQEGLAGLRLAQGIWRPRLECGAKAPV